jgi:hypothetical protein
MVEPKTVQCPGCGLVIKLSTGQVDTCPVCGTALPAEDAAAGKRGRKKPPRGPESLEKFLSNRTGGDEAWVSREVLLVFFYTIFITFILRYFAYSAMISNGEIKFNPLLFALFNLAALTTGLFPILYILVSRMSFTKLGLRHWSAQTLVVISIVGIGAGFGLVFIDMLNQDINNAIYAATGWAILGPSQFNIDYDAFLQGSILARVGFGLMSGFPVVLAELLARGTVLNGFMQHFGKTRIKNSRSRQLSAFFVAIGLNVLYDFVVSLFDPTGLLESVMVNIFLGCVFLIVKDIRAVMIAQAVLVFMSFLFL